MQDIRKPYNRSKSNRVLDARVEAFEKRRYPKDDEVMEEVEAEREHRHFSEVETPIYRNHQVRVRAPRQKKSKEMWIFSGVVGLLGIFALLYTFIFNSATITLTPKYADIPINRPVVFANDDTGEVHFTLATTTMEKSKDLPTSGTKKVQTKASGTITVYNNYDANPQRLLKNTRFESSDGKIYRTTDSVTVPGKKGSVPGSISVTVFADSYGEDYNIPASDFTIPGFKNTPRYTAFYGRGVGPMTGGASGDKKLVSATDLASAKDELALSLTQDIKTQMQKMTFDGQIPLVDNIEVLFDDNEKDVLAGNTATYHVTATGYMVLAKEGDVAKAIAKAQSQYNGEPLRLDNKAALTFSMVKDSADISKDTSFEVLFDGTPRVVWIVDDQKLSQLLSGKSKADFPEVLHSFPSIQKAEMTVAPAWVSQFPDTPAKITIVEKLPTLSK